MMYKETCLVAPEARDKGKLLTFRRNLFVLQVLPAPIKARVIYQVLDYDLPNDIIAQQRHYFCRQRSESVR